VLPAFGIVSARKGEIVTTMNGRRYAPGIGGSILGRGPDQIVIDDPMKVDAAFSAKERMGWTSSTTARARLG
jgi:hypothetical protein